MNTLNLGSDEMPEKKKKSNTRNLKIALGLAAVILVPTIGSTLAGQIDINTDGAIEFGQGVLTTAACDGAIDILPQAALIGDVFIATQIAVSDINTATCAGVTFTLKMLSDTDIAQPIGGSNATQCEFIMAGSTPFAITANDCAVTDQETGMFIFNTATPLATTAFEKITIESDSN